MDEVFEFLSKAQTFYIATIDGDQPRVRPFGAVCKFEGKLYIVTSNTKNVFKQMIANPKVEISGMTPEGKWIRLAATVVPDERREARKAMLDAVPSLRSMYNEDGGKIEVLYLKDATASVCSFTEPTITLSF